MYSQIKHLLDSSLQTNVVIERPKNKDFGHFATPVAFNLAKSLKKPPKIIADEICETLKNHREFSKVENVNGYINLTLSNEFLNKQANLLLDSGYRKNILESKKILIEFVSANPTGPLHIGHARGAVLGDSLVKMGRFLGLDIQSEYYINDAGAQIKLLGLSIHLASLKLSGFNPEYPEKYYKGEYINDLAEKAESKFEKEFTQNSENINELAEFGKELMLIEIKNNLSSIEVEFDNFVSEKEELKKWNEVLVELKQSKKVYEKDNKLFLESSAFGDSEDRVIVKENGEAAYLAGDIIYHRDKFKRGFDNYINIWGSDHHGYITRVKAAIEFLGFDSSKLEIILAQMVGLLKDGAPYKMSKRAGTYILMRDVVLDIGADIMRFVFLSKRPDTHLEFEVSDLQKADNTNPVFYINYANARIHTLLSKTKLDSSDIDKSEINDKNAIDLVFNALLLPRVVLMAWEEKSAQKICEFTKNLAGDFHAFYNNNKILGESNEAQFLKASKIVSHALESAFFLLGIKAKRTM